MQSIIIRLWIKRAVSNHYYNQRAYNHYHANTIYHNPLTNTNIPSYTTALLVVTILIPSTTTTMEVGDAILTIMLAVYLALVITIVAIVLSMIKKRMIFHKFFEAYSSSLLETWSRIVEMRFYMLDCIFLCSRILLD